MCQHNIKLYSIHFRIREMVRDDGIFRFNDGIERQTFRCDFCKTHAKVICKLKKKWNINL